MTASSGPGEDGRGEDLRAAVEPDDRPLTAARRGALEERERDVGAAGPDVEQGELRSMRGQRVDGGRRQRDAAEPVVDPPQVAQVAGQRRRVVERTVEEFGGVGEAVHRAP